MPAATYDCRHPQWQSGAIAAAARKARVPVIMYHDILPDKQVFFDVTPQELQAHFEAIKVRGLTPIPITRLLTHLTTGERLPSKPIVLSFDDGYSGHFDYVLPLLRRYNYPAVFSIFTAKLDGRVEGRSTLTWSQLASMAASPLVTIASHSDYHPADLRQLSDQQLHRELIDSKRRLESQLGHPIKLFTYPAGHHDQRVIEAVKAAGYDAAFTMSNTRETFAGGSPHRYAIARFGQSRLAEVLPQAFEGDGCPTQANPAAARSTEAALAPRITGRNSPVPLAADRPPYRRSLEAMPLWRC